MDLDSKAVWYTCGPFQWEAITGTLACGLAFAALFVAVGLAEHRGWIAKWIAYGILLVVAMASVLAADRMGQWIADIVHGKVAIICSGIEILTPVVGAWLGDFFLKRRLRRSPKSGV